MVWEFDPTAGTFVSGGLITFESPAAGAGAKVRVLSSALDLTYNSALGTVSGTITALELVDQAGTVLQSLTLSPVAAAGSTQGLLGTAVADTFDNSILGISRTFVGLDGDDHFIGSTDTGIVDTIDYGLELLAGAAAGVVVNMSGTVVNGLAAGQAIDTRHATDTLENIDNITGTQFDDIIIGSSANNVLEGGTGSDLLRGGAGDDILRCGRGGSSFDTLIGDAGGDTFDASASDAPSSAVVRFQLEAGVWGVAINLDSGAHDITLPNLSSGTIAASQGRDSFGDTDTFIGIVNVIGTSRGDEMWGGIRDEMFNAGPGDDRIHGGAGADTLFYASVAGLTQNSFSYAEGIIVTFFTDGTSGMVVAASSADGEPGTDTFDGIETVAGTNAADIYYGAANAANRFVGMAGRIFSTARQPTQDHSAMSSTIRLTRSPAFLEALRSILRRARPWTHPDRSILSSTLNR